MAIKRLPRCEPFLLLFVHVRDTQRKNLPSVNGFFLLIILSLMEARKRKGALHTNTLYHVS